LLYSGERPAPPLLEIPMSRDECTTPAVRHVAPRAQLLNLFMKY